MTNQEKLYTASLLMTKQAEREEMNPWVSAGIGALPIGSTPASGLHTALSTGSVGATLGHMTGHVAGEVAGGLGGLAVGQPLAGKMIGGGVSSALLTQLHNKKTREENTPEVVKLLRAIKELVGDKVGDAREFVEDKLD